jgi:hypothetical protein
VFFGLVAVAAVAAGAGGTGDLRVVVILPLAPLAAGAALLAVALWTRARYRSTGGVRLGSLPDGTPALALPYSVRACVAMWLLGVGLAVEAAALAVISALAATGGTSAAWLGVVGFGALCLYGLVGLFDGLRGRLARGALLLGQDAVVARGWGADTALTWVDVTTVAAGDPSNQTISVSGRAPTRIARSLLWRSRRTPTAANVVGALLTVDPALAYHALRFYLANPAARAELGTDAAVRRVRAGNVHPVG